MTIPSLPFDFQEMAKFYEPAKFEVPLYEWWEAKGFFKPEIAGPEAEPFVIAIPPPNVTGELHLGHVMFVALEDLMIRYHRMQGKAALWVPGTDHAGIATQLQVEKLLRAEGTSREEVGREEFLRRTWEWKEKYGGQIGRQLRRIGASCDWDRERFTMDEGLSRAVYEAFVRLHEAGLIYRGEYLINWSPGLQTAVSDLEVEYAEEQGHLYFFKYPLAESTISMVHGQAEQDYLPVATTRPETILGDTALAVHPDDMRYQHLIGQYCLVPMLNRAIPIIADDYVDMEFGTGALKITPGHDPNDFAIGKKHELAIINIMNKDATLNEHAGPYAGLDRFEARQKLWHDMSEAGLTIETKAHTMQVPRSQRGGEVVEPLISTQWFVKMETLAVRGLEAVHQGDIRLIPEHFVKVYEHWLENIRDWCISRQLWWGHRIPVWYCRDCSEMIVAREDPTHCPACNRSRLEQDPDVLDTWFSSGLWPFSTLGWPDDTPDLQRYYPTDVMETGYDILFFWVARMIMQGLNLTDKIPFHTIYLHGLVRDEQGRKMSKTTGNIIDPLEVMDEFGTDALRFTLLTGSTPGNDMNLSLTRVESNRNFSNKIWNATRFVLSNLDDDFEAAAPTIAALTRADRWILSRLNHLIEAVTRLVEEFNFGEAGRQMYDFFWSEYADWYIEIAKIQIRKGDETQQIQTRRVLVHTLEQTLRLLHPYVPFITEAAWQHLPHEDDEQKSLCLVAWPRATFRDEAAEEAMQLTINLIRTIRNARAENNVQAGRRITALIAAGDKATLLQTQGAIITDLARLDGESLEIAAVLAEKPLNAITVVAEGGLEIYLPFAGLLDIAEQRGRLAAELAQLEKVITHSAKTLANENFVNKAPATVVEKERAKLSDLQTQAEMLRSRLETLSVGS